MVDAFSRRPQECAPPHTRSWVNGRGPSRKEQCTAWATGAEAIRKNLSCGVGLELGDLGGVPPKRDYTLARMLSGGREWFCHWASRSFLE